MFCGCDQFIWCSFFKLTARFLPKLRYCIEKLEKLHCNYLLPTSNPRNRAETQVCTFNESFVPLLACVCSADSTDFRPAWRFFCPPLLSDTNPPLLSLPEPLSPWLPAQGHLMSARATNQCQWVWHSGCRVCWWTSWCLQTGSRLPYSQEVYIWTPPSCGIHDAVSCIFLKASRSWVVTWQS